MQVKAEDKAKQKREIVQLRRLERMSDVVYAIVIWRIFILLPSLTAEHLRWEDFSNYLSANVGTFLLVIIGVTVTIIYWLRNNLLLGNLQSTDTRHSALSILQLFFLIVFLVSLRESITLGSSPVIRVIESSSAAMVGIAGGWSWVYAVKNHHLLLPEVTEQYALKIRDRTLAEPITAIITIPMAFFGPYIWEISWLSYPLVVVFLKYRRMSIRE
jgi:hypothetical protein